MAGEGSASSIENAAALERDNQHKRDAWVQGANGPAEHAQAAADVAAVETPPTPPKPADAPPAPPAPPKPADAPAPPAHPGGIPAPGATAAAVADFIDAIVAEAQGDTPAQVLKIPATARIPLEVQGQIEYVTAAELRTRGMLEADYRLKTEEVGNARRELEEHAARLIADRARLGAREKHVADERKRLQEAQKSPEAWERYQNHLRLLQEDPEYAKVFEDALMGREMAAEDEANEAAAHHERVGQGIANAASWMLELAERPEYAHVDLDRVREIYAGQLETGRLTTIDPADVERIFRAEADQAHRAVGPLEARIAELSAQVQALQGKTDAVVHNKATQHAIDRAAAPPVNTGPGAAPGPADRKVKPFTPRELPEVNREWASRRD